MIKAAPAFGQSFCYRCLFALALSPGIPMQVVVPSVSRAATPHGRAATITVDTPSGPGSANPVGENCASSATPLTPFGAVGRASDGCWLLKASGDVPPSGAVPPIDPNGDGTPTPPPMTLPPVLAFGIPGVLVPFPPGPPPTAFKLGLPVPADPLPPGLFEFGDPPPTKPDGGPPPT
jgi:hypothetical protein